MVETVKGFFAKFSNDWAMNLAGMLAYNILVTIFPIVLALLTILGLVLAGNHDMLVSMQQAILQALPDQLRRAVDINAALAALAHNSGILAVISLVGLIWAGSNLFGVMESCFDIIFRTKPRDFVPQKLMSVAMIILFTILTPIMFGASTLINLVGSGANAMIPVHNAVTAFLLKGVSELAAVAAACVLFLTLYIVVPNLPLSVRHAWRGALVASVLLVIINLVFPTYVTLTMNGNKNYGSTLYLALIFVAWCWLFAVVLLVGAEVNAYAMGMRATEGDLATVLHRERVHEEGEDVPPSHEDTTGAGRGQRRADKLDRTGGQQQEAQPRGASGGARPSTDHAGIVARLGSAVTHAGSTVLGTVGTAILALVWLAYRAMHRPPRVLLGHEEVV